MNNKPVKISNWDVQDNLKSEDAMLAYLQAALEENDIEFLLEALADIAKARGMTQVAKDAGLARESLYKTLSAKGNPLFSTVMKIIHALGIGFKPYKLT